MRIRVRLLDDLQTFPSLTDLMIILFLYIDVIKFKPCIYAESPIRIRTCIQKRSCPCDVAAFRGSDYLEIAVLRVNKMMNSRVFLEFRISPLEKKRIIRDALTVCDERIIETPRAEKWTTMSAVRRGGRKNCGGARRPEEDHRKKI